MMSATRREFLTTSAAGVAALAAIPYASADPIPLRGRADHCIFLWLGGGMSQVDTFDPKPLGDPGQRVAGSAYDAIATAVPGVQVCRHLPRFARLLDRATICRTVHHEVIDEHAAATHRVHTGRPTTGTIQYPSVGSVIAHEWGSAHSEAPAYVLIGYPNASRGPGFLGPRHGYVYLTDTNAGPAGFSRPEDVTADRLAARERLLGTLRDPHPAAPQAAYEQTVLESLRLAGPHFMRAFRLDDEPAAHRASFGGEFGQRCLLSRRLIEAGVRFVEVSHNLNFINGTGWDIHNEGMLRQHVLIQELDTALAALIMDLEGRDLLDRTLIVVATEFGRPSAFDAGGGRGHQGRTFSLVLAGGGLRHQGAYGVTDELCQRPLENPVSIPDFHATIYAALGIDPDKPLHGGPRPVPITDGGRPIRALFAHEAYRDRRSFHCEALMKQRPLLRVLLVAASMAVVAGARTFLAGDEAGLSPGRRSGSAPGWQSSWARIGPGRRLEGPPSSSCSGKSRTCTSSTATGSTFDRGTATSTRRTGSGSTRTATSGSRTWRTISCRSSPRTASCS